MYRSKPRWGWRISHGRSTKIAVLSSVMRLWVNLLWPPLWRTLFSFGGEPGCPGIDPQSYHSLQSCFSQIFSDRTWTAQAGEVIEIDAVGGASYEKAFEPDERRKVLVCLRYSALGLNPNSTINNSKFFHVLVLRIQLCQRQVHQYMRACECKYETFKVQEFQVSSQKKCKETRTRTKEERSKERNKSGESGLKQN